MTGPDDAPPPLPADDPRARRRRRQRATLSLAVTAGIFALAIPQIASYDSVSRELASVSAAWAAGLAAATVLNILTFALPWMVLLPGLTLPSAVGFTQASTALVMVLPGGAPLGMGLSFAILRRLRISPARAGFSVALTGIWNQVSIFLFPAVGVALVLGTRPVSHPLVAAALGSAALAAATVGTVCAVLGSRRAAHRLGDALARAVSRLARRLGRRPAAWDGDSLVRLRADALELLRRRWPSLTAATLANQLTGYLLLAVSLRAVGIGQAELPVAETFTAWSVGRLVGSLPATPGGLGVVELSLIGTLAGFGGPHARIVAGVLLYRALIVVPTLLVGAATLLGWRLRGRRPDR